MVLARVRIAFVSLFAMAAVTPASDTLQTSSAPTRTVAIIGGGLTGAAVAYHLKQGPKAGQLRVVVFEPRTEIGKGAAYDTADPVHRINVPAVRMSLLPGEPDHFVRWLERTGSGVEDYQAARPDGSLFPQRGLFGNYVCDTLRPLLERGLVEHVRAHVEAVEHVDGRWLVVASNGTRLEADIVAIAASHPAPAPPVQLSGALTGHPRFVADPTQAGALAAIRPDDRVLVVGNGLTAADVIASLAHQGHHGTIVALSRRGLRSRGHPPFAQEPFGDFLTPPPATARQLLRRIRETIREAETQGFTWHPVLDQVRAQAGALWQALAVEERRRIVRHLRAHWDVHRFRIAPQVEDVLDAALASGRLKILAASVQTVETAGETITLTAKPRHGGARMHLEADAVVVTTGPAHGRILQSQAWLATLHARGFLDADPTGLGLACNGRSQALRTDHTPAPALYIAGPLARGYFGELMGLPQVTDHALFVAERIAEDV